MRTISVKAQKGEGSMGKKHKDKKRKKSIKELEEKRKLLLINGLIDIAVGSAIAIVTKVIEIVADMLKN